MLTPAQIEELIHLRIPEDTAREWLLALTPESVTPELFNTLLHTMAQTALPVGQVSVPVLDCCGTGGSGMSHFNTSTSSAFVLAAGGVPVVKFGNRAATSKSGSFDFLEALGLPLELPLESLPERLERDGLVFLFGPQCYPTLGKFQALRRSLGVKTVFNFMGPLLNPVKPAYKLLGVSNASMQTIMANYLARTNYTQRAWVVRGEPTLDEIGHAGLTHVLDVSPKGVTAHRYDAGESLNSALPDQPLEVADNLRIFEALISGEDAASPYHRMLCLNAGAGFVVAGKTPTLDEGTQLAAALLKSGAVTKTLENCRRSYAHGSR